MEITLSRGATQPWGRAQAKHADGPACTRAALRSKVRVHLANCGLGFAEIPSCNNGLVGHSLGVRSPPALNTIEMNRGCQAEPDGGKNLEVAMDAVVVRDLQAAGLIPSSARRPGLRRATTSSPSNGGHRR